MKPALFVRLSDLLPRAVRSAWSVARSGLALVCTGLGFAALFSGRLGASSPVVDLKTYVSSSGRCALEVDPTEICGRGPAHYRLVVGGEEAWNKSLPFTFYDAVVMNDGTAIGYSYNHGVDGFAVKGGFAAGMGTMHVVVLDPKGGVRLDDVTKRKPSTILHAPPEPIALGILLQEEQDRFAIRIATERGESLWSYRCSTGKPLTRIDLRHATKAGWRVDEPDRKPSPPSGAEKPSPSPIEKRPLPLLGTFHLESATPEESRFDIDWFDFDTEGQIGTFRRPSGAVSFALLDPAGHVLAEVPVPKTVYDAELSSASAAFVGHGKWVLVASESKQESRSWGWWFDSREKRLGKPFPLVCPDVTKVAGRGDGGFVILARRRSQYSSVHELHGFDPQGSHVWALAEDHENKPGSLFSPEGIAVTGSGELAVLDNISKVVQFFGLDGKFRHLVDLKKSWKREPNYPSDIMPDVQGGSIIHDFNGSPPFVRMKVDGTVRGSLRPRHPDGRLVDTVAGLHVAPDGRVWVCDQHALFRLDDDGVVDLTIGHGPDPEDLGKIAAVTGDRAGRVYAVDERTGAIHVFDADGRKLRICKPVPGDFKENLRWPRLTVANDGDVYLATDDFSPGKPSYLHFAPDGRRLGFADFKVDDLQQVYFQPGTGNSLLIDLHFAGLVGPEGKVLKNIDRRADRLWLESISSAAFANDGSFVIQSEKGNSAENRPDITLFDRDGTVTRTFPLPPGFVSLVGYNGSHLVIKREANIEIYDRAGGPVQTFASGNENEVGVFLTRDGRELWSVDASTLTVRRYAMP